MKERVVLTALIRPPVHGLRRISISFRDGEYYVDAPDDGNPNNPRGYEIGCYKTREEAKAAAQTCFNDELPPLNWLELD